MAAGDSPSSVDRGPYQAVFRYVSPKEALTVQKGLFRWERGMRPAGVTSGCEPVMPAHKAALDSLGDEEGQDSVGMGQTRAPTAVVQVVKDSREVLAGRAPPRQFLEEAAGHGRGLVLHDGLLPLVAIFVGEGAEAVYPHFCGVLSQEGIHFAAELAEGRGIISLWRPWGRIFVFRGHNRTSPGAGFPPVREWRLGAEISCSRSFPLISAHFRALPPFRPGAGCSLGPGMGMGLKPALTRLGHGWVAVGQGADLFSRA